MVFIKGRTVSLKLMTTLNYDNNNFPTGITTNRAGVTLHQMEIVITSIWRKFLGEFRKTITNQGFVMLLDMHRHYLFPIPYTLIPTRRISSTWE